MGLLLEQDSPLQGQPPRAIITNTTMDERLAESAVALRASEERYRTLVDSIDEGFCVVEVLFDEQNRPLDYRFLEINPAFERHTGLKDAVGRSMRALVPDHDTHWFETYGRVALTGDAIRFESYAAAMGFWFDVYALRVGAPEERRVGVLFTNITERKQAEQALQEQGEYLRRLIGSSSDCITTLDLDGNILTISQRGLALLEIEEAASIVGRNWTSFFRQHRETRAGFSAARDAARKGGSGRFQGFCPTATGKPRWWDVTVTPILGMDNRPESLLAVARDITAQHEEQRRQMFLAELTERVRSLSDPDAVLYEASRMVGQFLGVDRCTFGEVEGAETEAGGTITVHRDYVRDGVPTIGGMTRPLLSFGRPIIEEMKSGIGASDGISAIEDVLTDSRVLPEHRSAFAELGIRSLLGAPVFKEGRWIALLVLHHGEPRPWPAEEKKLLAAVAESTRLAVDNARLLRSMQREVEERRRAEAELRRELQVRDAITASAADALFLMDGQGRVTFLNPAAEEMFGWPHGDLLGQVLHDALHHHRPDGTRYPFWECPLGEVMRSGTIVRGHEDTFFRRDGTPIPVQCSNAPLFSDGASGDVIGAVLIVSDITERKAREERERFLSALSERTRGLLSPEEVVWEAARSTGEFLHASRCTFVKVDEEQGVFTVGQDWTSEGTDRSAGAFSASRYSEAVLSLFRMGATLVVSDVQKDVRLTDADREAFGAAGVRTLINVPILREGRWAGTFAVNDAKPREWTEEDVALVASVAERTWLAIDSARLFRETRARAEREALLNQIGEAARGAMEPVEVLAVTVELLGKALGADRCYFVTYDVERDSGKIGPDWHRDVDGLSSIAGEYQLSNYAVNREARYQSGHTQVVDDVHEHQPEVPDLSGSGVDPSVSLMDALGLRSLIRAPLLSPGLMTALVVAMSNGPRHWAEEEVRLVETVATQTRAAVEATRIQQRERNIAQQLQDALQPPRPPALPGMALKDFYKPALEEAGVGGDFFDVFPLEKGCTALVVGDLSGKGLAAASEVATVRNMVRYALYSGRTIAEAVTNLDRILVEHDLLTGFATLFVGIYDHNERSLSYVNCGQEPGLIWRAAAGEVEQLPPTGPVLGGFESESGYDEARVFLFSGDVLALFTDGMTEVGRSRRQFLEVEGLAELFARCSAEESSRPYSSPKEVAESVVRGLVTGVEAYAGGPEGLGDDIALLVGVVCDSTRGAQS